MKLILTPLFRRIGTFLGGMLITAGMTQPDADLVVHATVAVGLMATDIALSRFNFMRSTND